MNNWIYVAFFWKNVTKQMLEDLTVLSVDEIRDYILEMWKYFYEKQSHILNWEGNLTKILLDTKKEDCKFLVWN